MVCGRSLWCFISGTNNELPYAYSPHNISSSHLWYSVEELGSLDSSEAPMRDLQVILQHEIPNS